MALCYSITASGRPPHLMLVLAVIEIGWLWLLVPAYLPSPGTKAAAPCRGTWRRAEDLKS